MPGTYDPRSVGPSPLAGPRGAAALHRAIARWYADHARALPWRDPECSPWAVLVSEVMLQQTPVSRVEPVWRRWLDSWPTPAQLATASPADAIRAWGRLGYPRRALRLLECARLIVERHHGDVPRTRGELTALPGVGDYTASAVLAFGYGERSVVLDTNVRRVLARVLAGQALPAPHLGATERARATEVLPRQPARAAAWGVGVMELGALVCTATSPDCAGCPLTRHCAWYQAGLPADDGPRRRVQSWAGSDRQVRGLIMAAVRESAEAIPYPQLAALLDGGAERFDRCLASLVTDGLVQSVTGAGGSGPATGCRGLSLGAYRLPS